MLRFFHFPVTAILLSAQFVSCHHPVSQSEPEIKPGLTYASVRCIADTAVDYAICIPAGYSTRQSYPLLILFDSHGNGLLPVNLFDTECSRQGIIVAGSNDSKNGMPMQQTANIYNRISADIMQRFSINSNAVYTGGFSGGARVAVSVAISKGDVAGVVGCGAGWPGYNTKPLKAFSYLGVAGTHDFNLSELRQLDEWLETGGFTHHLLTFGGKHEWPPSALIPDIVTWIKFDAMRNKAIPTDRKAIDDFINRNNQSADSAASERSYLQQLEIYLKMMHYLAGLTDISPLTAETDKLTSLPAVSEMLEKRRQLTLTEQAMQQSYSQQLETKPISWWETETKKLRSRASNNADPALAAMYERLLGSLSLGCYMLAANAFSQGNIDLEKRFTELYMTIDPQNAEHRYLAARIAARQHDADAVFGLLKQAVNMGFADRQRAMTEPDLKDFVHDSRFDSVFVKRK